MKVVGLDLSLQATGVAGDGWSEVLRPKSISYERLRWLRDEVFKRVVDADLVVVEGYYSGAGTRSDSERGGLWWMVTERIDDAKIPMAIAAPTSVKKYAVGVGGGQRAGKDYVLVAAVRRFGWFEGGNDEADALWCAAMGYDWLDMPLVDMPAASREALEKVKWPS